MALEVEDGTGKANAESYVSIADCNAYAVKNGHTFAIDGADEALAEQALRRATTWLDAYLRSRLTGQRTNLRAQALDWPRVGVIDREANIILQDEIPREIIAACCEAAVREKAVPGSLSPDVVPGEVTKRAKVEGAVEVEYAVGSSPVQSQQPVMTVVDGILASLFERSPSPYFGRSVRA